MVGIRQCVENLIVGSIPGEIPRAAGGVENLVSW